MDRKYDFSNSSIKHPEKKIIMEKYIIKISKILFLLGFVLIFSNCKRDKSDDAKPATFPKNGEVFIDGFSAGLEYLPFGDSYFAAFTVDEETKYKGTSAMRFDVPNVGDPDGAYAGAIFPDYGGRDLSDFDALTFWAKGTEGRTINDVGFGQDFNENKYQVAIKGALEITTNWRKYIIPLPDPSKLTRENGLFWYAEGPNNDGTGWTFWIDELQFEKLGTIAQPRPSILEGQDITTQSFVGVVTPIANLNQTFNLGDGKDQTLTIAPAYFTFSSSDPNVATVNEKGEVTAVSEGTAVVTAELNGVDAAGSLTITVSGDFDPAPTPTQDPTNVISIFSDAYTNQPVDYYNGYWAPFQTTIGQDDININGDNIITYTDLNFVGIQFLVDAPTINASSMTRFHVDIQPREDLNPGDFLTIRVADVGPDNEFGTGDDTSGEITLDNSNLVNGEWYSLDVAFSDLPGLVGRSNLAQVVFVSDATISSIFVDNVYFYNDGTTGPMGPTVAAPTPTQDPADVISVFSDEYTNISGSDLNPNWGQATMVTEMPIAGNNTLRYAGLNYQGLQLGSAQDVTSMEFLHIDYWTANSSALNAFLISSGPVETAYALSVPTSGWASVDIPLSDFSPVDLADIIQLKFDGNGDIYLDNIYFYKTAGGGDTPTVAAPTPTQDPADVISVFSDSYTNIMGTDFNPNWGQATVVTQVPVDGNNTLMYAGLNYQGVQLGSAQDITSMEFLHIDYWTANSSALNAFLISGNATEVPKVLSVPTSGWASVDIPLGDFSPVDLADIIQFKFDGNGDIYLDNIYFYKTPGGGTTPTIAAPTPTQDPADVISVFSDSYTNIMGTDFNPNWGQATVVTQVPVDGNNTLMYAGLNYQGVQLGSAQDITSMEFLHIDYWTANSSALNAFLISGNATEVPKVLSVPTSGWASVDIPLGDFSPVDLADIIQFKFDGNGDIYLDNIYFYKTSASGEPELPLTFEDGVNPVIPFDNGATAAVIDNPDMNSNPSAKVLEFVKVVGSAWYSGVVYDDNLSSSPLIDLSEGTVFTVKVWSPNAGIDIRFQLEGGAAPAYEVFQTISDANQWVTLTFDFTSQVNASDTYPRFSLFPDFDPTNQNPVSVEAIYYIDDITQQ